jgi:hypothetical protein
MAGPQLSVFPGIRDLACFVLCAASAMSVLRVGFAITTAIGTACTSSGPGSHPQCEGGKCDGATGFQSQIDGLNDVIARWLRASSVDDQGVVATDADGFIKAIAQLQNCEESSVRTFMLADSLITGLSGTNFPRLISTVCSDDQAKSSDVFISTPFPEADVDDVDIQRVEMFAWDPTTKAYHFYATAAASATEVKFEVQPDRCRDCHRVPRDLAAPDDVKMPMTPIMNELTAPWPHWNALPDFPSQDFQVPDATAQAPHFAQLTGARLSSSARFEKIVRLAHARVEGARVLERRTVPASLDTAMGLLRPIFCSEQVQYATEDHASGDITSTVAIPGGIKEAYAAVSATWPWNWQTAGSLRFSANATAPLFMIPVRGNADIEVENRLNTTLTPQQILRVRALDWKHPVFSDLRCNLWKTANAHFQSSPPAIDTTQSTAALLGQMFEDIMILDGAPLRPAAADQLIVLDDAAKHPDFSAKLASGTIPTTCESGACTTDLTGFGDLLDAYATALENGNDRATVLAEGNRNICYILSNFPNAPALPDVHCP